MLNTYKTLEFNSILNNLSEFALSDNAKSKIMQLQPFLNERECKKHMNDTTEAKMIIEGIGTPPLAAMENLDEILTLAHKGSMLVCEQLTSIATFIHSCSRMSSFLKKAEMLDVSLAYYSTAFINLPEIKEEIERSIRYDKVDSSASKTLQDIRRKIENAQSSIKAKLEEALRSKKAYLSDNSIVVRNGRYALPVKKEYKNQISGSVIDTSNTGGTVFIEPSSVAKAQADLGFLQIEEENEIRKILYTLTAMVDENIDAFNKNMGYMQTLDFVFAKAKYSYKLKANEVPINTSRVIKIVNGCHPLINAEECVPLNFNIGEDYRGVIITGPNTGGKTVALKTVGILSLMAQCGLHVPAQQGSTFCMHANILCDIGDGQSIKESLSTFSAHITNIVDILKQVTHESLILLDELGSGTDPAEGMGIAVAILDELRKTNCLFLATTHYPEIKEYAKHTHSLINARMKFDKENLKPLYKLEIGEAGESCALSIAQRLGLPKHILNYAQKTAYGVQPTNIATNTFIITCNENENHPQKKSSKIVKDIPTKTNELKNLFNTGDSVTILSDNSIGIVYKPINDKGDLIVQVKGIKYSINHKRVKLKTKAEELYPNDYDFSIIFDTVENRKARHKMNKGHSEELIISYDEFTK